MFLYVCDFPPFSLIDNRLQKQSKYSSKKGIKTVSLQGKKNNANTAQQHDHEGVFSAVYDRGNVQKVEPVEVRLKEPASTGRVNVVETKNGTEAQLELNIDAAPAEPTVAINGSPLPRCVRIIGHSAGGAVGAYMAMVLEGSLHCSRGPLESVSGLVGLYKEPGLVRCVALGPPPCISRTIVPRFVTTVLCGDDIVPRAGPAALKHLRERAYKALKVRRLDVYGDELSTVMRCLGILSDEINSSKVNDPMPHRNAELSGGSGNVF